MRSSERGRWRTALVVLAFASATLSTIASRPAQAAGASETVAYRIKDGDTLLGLTARYLRGANAYEAVVQSNSIPDPQRISPGQVIRVPVAVMRSSPLNAKLASFKGGVGIQSGTKARTPTIGMAIREGDILQTAADGFVTIVLSNGSRMTLPTKSRVRILHMRQFLLTKSTDFDFLVDQGRTELSVTPARDPNNLFRLRTPIAVSAVRGTRFRIGYDNGDAPSLTEVLEGKVAVDGPNSAAASSLVPAGYGAAAAASGKVGTEELLPAPVIKDAGKTWRTRALDFELVPVPTAQGYHLQLAKDAAFQDMVAEARSTTPQLRLAEIENGTYFGRAMAIAPSGLEGLSETYTIKREMAPLLGGVTLMPDRRARFQWESAGSGSPIYRLQLFSNADTPIIDEAGLETHMMTVDGLAPGRYTWRVGMKRLTDGVLTEYWTDTAILAIPGKE